jgi:hypothetical protein
LILDKNGNLTDKIYYTTPARDIKMTHIRSAGLEGVMSWACTFDGKLYIWGGSFLDESGIGFTSSPLRYFSGSFPWNGSFVEPMEILANLGLKIRQAHIIAFDYGVTAPPEDYLNDVCLCFVTQSNDLYLYHKTEGIFYPKAWTGSAFEYAYYTPPLYYYKVASNVRTARMFMPGYNRTTSYVSIPAALPGKPISTGLGSFTQEMPSLVWIDKAGNFCGYGINCAGEMGPGSVDDSRITIPGLSAAPTWSAYLAIIGLNETISMSYAEWLAAGQPFPILSNDAYCWDAGGVTRYTDAGAAAWTYFQVIYLPQEKWREPTYKWPPYPIRKTGGIIIAGNFVSMTTIGYQRYIEDRAYVNGVEGGLGVNMMYSTLLLDSSGKLWGLGTHYPIGQLGDYRGYAGPWNRTLYDGYGTSSPWNMFAGIVFTKLHPTFQRFFNYESEEGTYGILFADALVDGKKVTYMWGVSSVSHKTWDWIVQHEIATPPLPGGTEIKYIACGDMRQWALSQDLLAVSVDGKYYVATYQHNDPEVMTAPIWQYAGQL